jgi:hypothetical protein
MSNALSELLSSEDVFAATCDCDGCCYVREVLKKHGIRWPENSDGGESFHA